MISASGTELPAKLLSISDLARVRMCSPLCNKVDLLMQPPHSSAEGRTVLIHAEALGSARKLWGSALGE